MSVRIQLMFGCAAVLLASCSSEPTRIALSIEYGDAWGIGALEIRSGERMKSIPAQHAIELWIPDSWAGTEVSIRVRGLRGEESIASGGVMVTPVLGGRTEASIVLHRVACGAWCTEGETRCFGDAVAICEQRDSDPCMEWGTPIACVSDAPYCSLGQCRAECIDECAEGEQRCDGPNGYQLCGNFDGDTCREWSTATTCEEGQSCNAGTCIIGECRDQCTSGSTECRGSSVVTCGDLNADGCTEWGPATRCASMSCNAGQCTEACTDDCSVDACAGSSFHECGQFDEDPCLDRSPGLSCTPADLCLEGACSDTTGCTSTARTCDDPPAQTCIDADTLRVYDAVGECTAGDCNYTLRDIACPSCPSCDSCAGVTCNMPPTATCANASTRRTFASSGTCDAGRCNYAPIDTACNASPAATCVNASTRRTFASTGTCMAGECNYAPIDTACNRPPEAMCINASTLRTHTSTGTCSAGECSYSHADTSCPNGCMNGVCQSLGGGTWTPMPAGETGPSARSGHRAVWTGTEMIIWGGWNGSWLQDGYRYNPATNTWASISTVRAPSARFGHSAVWTGSEMIIWGGVHVSTDEIYLYNPATNSWRVIESPSPVTRTRYNHSAVWTGTLDENGTLVEGTAGLMMIWGGTNNPYSYSDGYRYNPRNNSWSAAISTEGAPIDRYSHSAVWTGTEMIVWGGQSYAGHDGLADTIRDGYRYIQMNNTWSAPISMEGAPSGRNNHSAVWTGTEMIIWGGRPGQYFCTCRSDGGRYNPSAGTWTAISTTGAPAGRSEHSAVWTGSEMIIWGGEGEGGSYLRDGGRWRP